MRREPATAPAWALSRGIGIEMMAKTENRKPKNRSYCWASSWELGLEPWLGQCGAINYIAQIYSRHDGQQLQNAKAHRKTNSKADYSSNKYSMLACRNNYIKYQRETEDEHTAHTPHPGDAKTKNSAKIQNHGCSKSAGRPRAAQQQKYAPLLLVSSLALPRRRRRCGECPHNTGHNKNSPGSLSQKCRSRLGE